MWRPYREAIHPTSPNRNNLPLVKDTRKPRAEYFIAPAVRMNAEQGTGGGAMAPTNTDQNPYFLKTWRTFLARLSPSFESSAASPPLSPSRYMGQELTTAPAAAINA